MWHKSWAIVLWIWPFALTLAHATDQSFSDMKSHIVHIKIDKLCFHSLPLTKIVGTVKLGNLELFCQVEKPFTPTHSGTVRFMRGGAAEGGKWEARGQRWLMRRFSVSLVERPSRPSADGSTLCVFAGVSCATSASIYRCASESGIGSRIILKCTVNSLKLPTSLRRETEKKVENAVWSSRRA